MSQRISIVDYGMGNLRSVQKALQHVAPDAEVTITSDAAAIRGADRVVFPGQGAMPDCMRSLAEHGLGDAVAEAALAERAHAVGHRALAREDHPVGAGDGCGVRGDLHTRFRHHPFHQRLAIAL